MLTLAQRNALDRFAKSLPALSDDFLIDAYHQAWEDHRDARAEGSDNIDKADAEKSCDRNGDAGALSRLSTPLQAPVPVNELVIHSPAPVVPTLVAAAGERAGMRFLEFFAANIRNPHTRRAYYRGSQAFVT